MGVDHCRIKYLDLSLRNLNQDTLAYILVHKGHRFESQSENNYFNTVRYGYDCRNSYLTVPSLPLPYPGCQKTIDLEKRMPLFHRRINQQQD